MRTRRKHFKLDGRKRVLRYEIQGQKFVKLIDGLGCCQKLVTCGFVGGGVWFFTFCMMTKNGPVYLNRRFRFKCVDTPTSFNKIHVPIFRSF